MKSYLIILFVFSTSVLAMGQRPTNRYVPTQPVQHDWAQDVIMSSEVAGYISIPNIKGESQKEGREGQIEIYGLSMHTPLDVSKAQGNPHGNTPLLITKMMDLSTPKIMEAYAKNSVIPQIEIHLINTADHTEVVQTKIILRNVRIAGINANYINKPMGKTEIIALDYDGISLSYRTMGIDHSVSNEVRFDY